MGAGGGDRGGAGTWGPGGRRGAPRELKIATAKEAFISIDRHAELAISAALAAADKGDMAAQCRDAILIWQLYIGQLPGEEAGGHG